jgi:hypothetical protein
MPARDYMPGVPAAGHITSHGYWHSGNKRHCRKCVERCRAHQSERPHARCTLDEGHQGDHRCGQIHWSDNARR